MKRPNPDWIEEGDSVAVGFVTEGGCLSGVVKHVPCATGDSWIIRTDDGQLVYVQHFETMSLKAKRSS